MIARRIKLLPMAPAALVGLLSGLQDGRRVAIEGLPEQWTVADRSGVYDWGLDRFAVVVESPEFPPVDPRDPIPTLELRITELPPAARDPSTN